MKTKTIIMISIALVAVLVAGFAVRRHVRIVASGNEAAVRAAVERFGTNMREVPLLASTDERTASMDAAYGGVVAPELLAEWYPEDAGAFGWESARAMPTSMEITEIRREAKKYVAESIVTESREATDGTATPVSRYAAAFELEKRGDRWMIVAAERSISEKI